MPQISNNNKRTKQNPKIGYASVQMQWIGLAYHLMHGLQLPMKRRCYYFRHIGSLVSTLVSPIINSAYATSNISFVIFTLDALVLLVNSTLAVAFAAKHTHTTSAINLKCLITWAHSLNSFVKFRFGFVDHKRKSIVWERKNFLIMVGFCVYFGLFTLGTYIIQRKEFIFWSGHWKIDEFTTNYSLRLDFLVSSQIWLFFRVLQSVCTELFRKEK